MITWVLPMLNTCHILGHSRLFTDLIRVPAFSLHKCTAKLINCFLKLFFNHVLSQIFRNLTSDTWASKCMHTHTCTNTQYWLCIGTWKWFWTKSFLPLVWAVLYCSALWAEGILSECRIHISESAGWIFFIWGSLETSRPVTCPFVAYQLPHRLNNEQYHMDLWCW